MVSLLNAPLDEADELTFRWQEYKLVELLLMLRSIGVIVITSQCLETVAGNSVLPGYHDRP
jgi:hypothetical protein